MKTIINCEKCGNKLLSIEHENFHFRMIIDCSCGEENFKEINKHERYNLNVLYRKILRFYSKE